MQKGTNFFLATKQKTPIFGKAYFGILGSIVMLKCRFANYREFSKNDLLMFVMKPVLKLSGISSICNLNPFYVYCVNCLIYQHLLTMLAVRWFMI